MRNESFLVAGVIILLLWILYKTNPTLSNGQSASSWWSDNVDKPLQNSMANLFGWNQKDPTNPTGPYTPGMGAVLGSGISGSATQNGVPIPTVSGGTLQPVNGGNSLPSAANFQQNSMDFSQQPAYNASDWLTPVQNSNGTYGFSLS